MTKKNEFWKRSMPIRIRPLVIQDTPYLYEICLKTGDAGKDASPLFADPYLLGQYYAAPYALYPNALGFIVEKDWLPRAYIVSVPDSAAFRLWMERVWLPPLRERYPLPYPAEKTASESELRLINLLYTDRTGARPPWYASYPAHLHIDLLPDIQGQGWGRKLTRVLFDALAEQKVPGLHLGVSRRNPGAMAFYDKIGLSVLEEDEKGQTRGKAL
jgi:GNAT superfamily N-acetyltransferase